MVPHRKALKQTPFGLHLRQDVLEVEPHSQVLSNISSGSKTHGTVHYIIPLRLVPVSPSFLSIYVRGSSMTQAANELTNCFSPRQTVPVRSHMCLYQGRGWLIPTFLSRLRWNRFLTGSNSIFHISISFEITCQQKRPGCTRILWSFNTSLPL